MGMKIFRMHSLYAGHGDCLWIEYGDDSDVYRILVDAGTAATAGRVKAALDKVRTPAKSHELLVVTHVDADHIAGVLPIVESDSYANNFRDIWFNGRTHLNPGSTLEPFGAVQGERLTTALRQEGVPWNAFFGGKSVSLKQDDSPVSMLLPGGAKLTLLSPSWSQLQSLIPKWEREVKKAGLDPSLDEVPPQEVPAGFEALGGINVDQLAASPFQEDTAEANGSSIAMLIEYAGKRLLLGADAHPSILISSIKKLSGGRPLPVDVFKLPHHGSKFNVSRELMEMIPCKTALFSTSGAYFSHPDREAVARVIKYSPEGVELVFNCESKQNKVWRSDSLKTQWKYKTRYGLDKDGISIFLT